MHYTLQNSDQPWSKVLLGAAFGKQYNLNYIKKTVGQMETAVMSVEPATLPDPNGPYGKTRVQNGITYIQFGLRHCEL